MKVDYKKKLKLVAPMLIFITIYMVFFFLVESIDASSYYVPEIAFDHDIPFIPAFIIPYVMWFPWIPFICLWALFTDEKVFTKITRLLMIGMSLFIIISAIFPTKLFLRPDEVPGNDICSKMVKYLYSIDTPTNVFPSIHVYDTLVLCYGVFIGKCALFKNTLFRIFTVALTVAICMATCFLKQHSVTDGIAAVVMLVVAVAIYDLVASAFAKKKGSGKEAA